MHVRFLVDLGIVTGSAQPELGRSLARALGFEPIACAIERFPDGEMEIRVTESLHGREVFIVQATSPPAGEHLLELLLIADARVAVRGLLGDVRGKSPVLVDDMISTGETIAAAARTLAEAGARDDLSVAATHGLLVGRALALLEEVGGRRLFTTDSVSPPGPTAFPHHIVGLAPLIGEAIRRLARGASLRAPPREG